MDSLVIAQLAKDPIALAAEYRRLGDELKALESRQNALKPYIQALIPEKQKAVALATEIDGEPYEYVIERVEQDRRKLDEDKLAKFLLDNGLQSACMKKWIPDPKKVAHCVESGDLTKADIVACMVGTITKYALVKLRKVGSEDTNG